MTISIKPTSSGSTIEQDGGAILSVDGSGNLTVPNNITFSGTVTGVSSYADSDALSLFNASGSAPVYACRAWVNFNGTGTVAIRSSGNVSSITDLGTGNYNVNFSTAMPDTNYSTVTALNYNNSTFVTNVGALVKLPTTSKIEIEVGGTANQAFDVHTINVAVFR